MGKYSFNGKTITASSRKEAAKIFAEKTKVTASSKLPDELYELYGEEYLRDEQDDAEIYRMDQLDEMLGEISPSEAIKRGAWGHDFTGDINDRSSNFNPNEDYFAYDGRGNLVSIRDVYKYDWIKANIDESYFEEWLKNEEKEEYKDILRDAVEEEIDKVRSKGKMFGFDSPKLGYSEVTYDRDDDTLRCFDSFIDYDYDMSLDENLEALYEEIQSDNPDAFDEDEE